MEACFQAYGLEDGLSQVDAEAPWHSSRAIPWSRFFPPCPYLRSTPLKHQPQLLNLCSPSPHPLTLPSLPSDPLVYSQVSAHTLFFALLRLGLWSVRHLAHACARRWPLRAQGGGRVWESLGGYSSGLGSGRAGKSAAGDLACRATDLLLRRRGNRISPAALVQLPGALSPLVETVELF